MYLATIVVQRVQTPSVPGQYRNSSDKIDLSGFTSIASLDNLTLSQRTGYTQIDLPGGGEIRVLGIEKSALENADNFIFYTKPISGNRGVRISRQSCH